MQRFDFQWNLTNASFSKSLHTSFSMSWKWYLISMIYSCNDSRLYHFVRMFSSLSSIYHAVIKFRNVYEEDFILLEDIHNHWKYVKREFLSDDRINWFFQIWTRRLCESLIRSTKFADNQISRSITRCEK